MADELYYDKNNDCVVLRTEGVITLDLIKRLAPQVALKCEEANCYRVLNDMSAADINVSLLEVYQSPKVMDESKALRQTTRALVVPPDFPEAEFLENVTRNRGHNLVVFTDVEKAKRWLLGK